MRPAFTHEQTFHLPGTLQYPSYFFDMVPEEVMATSIPTHASYLAQILQDGKVSDEDYGSLTRLYAQEVEANNKSRNKDFLLITIPGNITLTRSTNRSNLEAMSAVLNTVELLEYILGLLPFKQLVEVVPYVCRGFYQITKSSLLLRRRLFRASDDNCEISSPLETFKLTGLYFYRHDGYYDSLEYPDVNDIYEYPRLDQLDPKQLNGTTLFMTSPFHKHCSTTIREMLITLPTTRRLVAYDAAPEPSEHELELPASVLYKAEGITNGDFIDWVFDGSSLEFFKKYEEQVLHYGGNIAFACYSR